MMIKSDAPSNHKIL